MSFSVVQGLPIRKQKIENKISKSSIKLISFLSIHHFFIFIFFPQIHGTCLSPLNTAKQKPSLEKVCWCRKMRKRSEVCQRMKTYFLSSCVKVLTFHWWFSSYCKNNLFILTTLFLVLCNKLSLANFQHTFSLLMWCF